MKILFTLSALLLVFTVNAQVKILGRALDNKNKALAGVSIVLKNTYDGATTDSAGNFSFSTTENGEQVFEASSSGYKTFEQKISITPSSVILLYEATNSYVPPLYEGRSLPSDGALVRVTALPSMSDDGGSLPPSRLSYVWSVNDVINRTASGLGKQTANVRLDFLEDKNTVKVVIRSPRGNVATKTIIIYPHPIMPLLYKYDQVLGPNFTSLIETRFETIQDFALALEPFYVSKKDQTGEPSYTWYLDGLPTTPLGGKILAMHPKEDSYGAKQLRITVQGPDKRIQNAETSLELIFDTRK